MVTAPLDRLVPSSSILGTNRTLKSRKHWVVAAPAWVVFGMFSELRVRYEVQGGSQGGSAQSREHDARFLRSGGLCLTRREKVGIMCADIG